MAMNERSLERQFDRRGSEFSDFGNSEDPLMASSSPRSAVFPTVTPRPSLRSSYAWLFAYFFFNLALTIYNKFVLAGNFPFPYTLTAVHALSGSIGSYICWKRGVFTLATLSTRETVQIILFSGLYTINIVVSNVSL
jgi:hypothetical protein